MAVRMAVGRERERDRRAAIDDALGHVLREVQVTERDVADVVAEEVGRHAVRAAKVTAVGDRYPHIGQATAQGVNTRAHRWLPVGYRLFFGQATFEAVHGLVKNPLYDQLQQPSKPRYF